MYECITLWHITKNHGSVAVVWCAKMWLISITKAPVTLSRLDSRLLLSWWRVGEGREHSRTSTDHSCPLKRTLKTYSRLSRAIPVLFLPQPCLSRPYSRPLPDLLPSTPYLFPSIADLEPIHAPGEAISAHSCTPFDLLSTIPTMSRPPPTTISAPTTPVHSRLFWTVQNSRGWTGAPRFRSMTISDLIPSIPFCSHLSTSCLRPSPTSPDLSGRK